MKHMKQKLIAMTAMMVLSAIMLSSVSYAWFTLSTNPEITEMKVNVAANQNLEIALDNGYADETAVNNASKFDTTSGAQGSKTGNPYTWGNLLDLSYAFGTNGFTPMMQPVKFTNTSGAGSFSYPKYGEDGRVSALDNLVETVFSDLSTVANPTGGVKGYSVTTKNAPYYAFSVEFWVRTNVAGNLTLSEATERASDGIESTTSKVNDKEGAGSYFMIPGYEELKKATTDAAKQEQAKAIEEYVKNLRIAFVNAEKQTVQAQVATITAGGKCLLTIDDATTDGTTEVITALTANVAEKVTMYIYLDGETITNADALLFDINDVIFNIQFANDALVGDAMTGNDA